MRTDPGNFEKNDALQWGNRLGQGKGGCGTARPHEGQLPGQHGHEIRTPLNGVLGMLGLALESEKDQGQRNRLEIALNAGENLLGLLNDILDISKVEAGKLSLETIPFSMRKLIDECTTLHRQQAEGKQIQLISETDPDLPACFLVIPPAPGRSITCWATPSNSPTPAV